MTATTAVLLPVQKKRVRAAILNALGRHGVSAQTAESIWTDLTTGNDPRPADLPEQFHYRGIKIDWPLGRHLRLLRKDEIKSLNAALVSAGVRGEKLLDDEDNAAAGRQAYTWLYGHKGGKESVVYGPYNPEPVRAAKLRELVEEATAEREAENAPLLVHEGEDPYTGTVTEPEAETETVTEQCGVQGPFAGVTCKREPHEGDDHLGCGYGWTGEDEPVASDEPSEPQACPFERDECLAMQEQGEGACDEHEPPTREELIASLTERTNVQIVTTPERVTTAQVVALEPATDVDALLAELRDLANRLEGK